MPHTPEPWNVQADLDHWGYYVIEEAATQCEELFKSENDEDAEKANAIDEGNRRLIQAAPDMLYALQDALFALVMQYANTGAVDDCRRLENARAAIRKGGKKTCR